MVFLTFSQRLTTNETAVAAEFELSLPLLLPVIVLWKLTLSQNIKITHQRADIKKAKQPFVGTPFTDFETLDIFFNQITHFNYYCLPGSVNLQASVYYKLMCDKDVPSTKVLNCVLNSFHVHITANSTCNIYLQSPHFLNWTKIWKKLSLTVMNFIDWKDVGRLTRRSFYEHHEQRRIYSPRGVAEEKMRSINE